MAQYATPNEIGGIMVGSQKGIIDALYLIKNIGLDGNKKYYNAEPQQLYDSLKVTTYLDKSSMTHFLGMWHTHPNGPAIPSTTDKTYQRFIGYSIIYSIPDSQFKAYYVNDKLNLYTEVDLILV